MSIPAALLYKINRNYKVGAVFFDLELSESHNFSNTVSQHVIEDGSIISDHIQNELFTGNVSGLISNFSINIPGVVDRAQNAFDAIVDLWRAKEIVEIVTFFKVYNNVVITGISIAKNADTGDALIADFSFQEIKKVSLQEVEVQANINLENMEGEQNKQSAPEAKLGRQTEKIR